MNKILFIIKLIISISVLIPSWALSQPESGKLQDLQHKGATDQPQQNLLEIEGPANVAKKLFEQFSVSPLPPQPAYVLSLFNVGPLAIDLTNAQYLCLALTKSPDSVAVGIETAPFSSVPFSAEVTPTFLTVAALEYGVLYFNGDQLTISAYEDDTKILSTLPVGSDEEDTVELALVELPVDVFLNLMNGKLSVLHAIGCTR